MNMKKWENRKKWGIRIWIALVVAIVAISAVLRLIRD
jgi:hypothetical protein